MKPAKAGFFRFRRSLFNEVAANNLPLPIALSRQEGSDPVVLIESFTHDADGDMTTRTNALTDDVLTLSEENFGQFVK